MNEIVRVDDVVMDWIESEVEVDGECGAPIEDFVGGGGDIVPSVVDGVRWMKMRVEICKAEEKRIAGIRKVLDNKIARAEDYIRYNMKAEGLKSVEFGSVRVSLRKASQSVVVTNEQAVPDKYKENRVTVHVSKKAIMDDIKATGEIPDGIDIVPGKESVVIK